MTKPPDTETAAAIAGSFKNQPIDPQTVMIGEVGLTGEVRSVMQLEARLAEAERLGFKRCGIPFSAKKGRGLPKSSMDLQYVKSLAEASDVVFRA